jgi:hypothetical protein
VLDELAEERDLPVVGRVATPAGDGARGDAPDAAAERASEAAPADEPIESPPTAPWLPRTPRRAAPAPPGRDVRGDGAGRTDAVSRAAPAQEEDALVAELADEGAAEGAGAELHVDEPWEGYASMRVTDIAGRLRGASSETLAAVRLYEQLHKGRRGVLTAVERELKRG